MRIIFSATDNNKHNTSIDRQFGRAAGFVFLDSETEKFEFINNSENAQAPQGAGIKTVQKLLEYKPELIITGNAPGEKAAKLLKKSPVKIYIGAAGLTIAEAVEKISYNELQEFIP